MKAKHLLILSLSVVILSSGCKKKDPEPEITYNYANAQVRGVNTSFKTTASFGKFCIMTGVCNTFYVDPSVTAKNYLMIGLPTTVKAGVTYTSDSSHTQVLFTDNTGRQFFSSQGDSLMITVTKWDGHGGTGAGTFSGKLRFQDVVAPYTKDSVYLKNGTFSAPIWYIIQ